MYRVLEGGTCYGHEHTGVAKCVEHSHVCESAALVCCQVCRNHLCRVVRSFAKRHNSSLHRFTSKKAGIPRLTFSSPNHLGTSPPSLASWRSSLRQTILSTSRSNKFLVGMGIGQWRPVGTSMLIFEQRELYLRASCRILGSRRSICDLISSLFLSS